MATAESPNQIDGSPNLKALFFKVPIQCACEGCKKKVKRILFKVQGVDSVDVDIMQQKVTVTGDVKPEALIKKLAKHGKEAKIWPENTVRQHKNIGKDKNKGKQSDLETGKPAAVHGGDKNVKPPEKVIAAAEESVKVGEGSSGGDAKDASEISGGGAEGEETKSEGRKPETGSGGNEEKSTAADNVSTESDNIVVEKKKTKGGQKGNKTRVGAGEPSNNGAPADTGSRNNISDPPPANHFPPRHQGYEFPQPTPPPAYAVSYNTANPSSRHTASFYSHPPPYSYAYSHADPVDQPPYSESYPSYEMQQGAALDRDEYRGQALDSFAMLSDENPNGCFIM